MAYRTIAGTGYLVREGEGSGRHVQIENRRRALDGGLLVDSIATKREDRLEITGAASAGRFFTIAEADALIATLLAGNVAVAGDAGTYTARARDIGWIDGQDWSSGVPVPYRWVSCVLDQL